MSKIGIKFIEGGRVYNIDSDIEVDNGEKVVLETTRGLEIGIVCKASIDDAGDEIKKLVRKAKTEDILKAENLKKNEEKVEKLTNELISKYKLEMKLVNVSFTLDGSKVIINYVCEDRVDFRELVKDLASQLKLRIELRQIGIRDQAKIIGGIGFCGKECCCKKYLNDFDKVSIKMAKTQGLSLNPTKISGLCGRLMCCLSYENELYAEASQVMPKINSKVRTKDGIGTVIYNNILKQIVTIKIENENDVKIIEYEVKDIELLPRNNEIKDNKKIKPNTANEKVLDCKYTNMSVGKNNQNLSYEKGNKNLALNDEDNKDNNITKLDPNKNKENTGNKFNHKNKHHKFKNKKPIGNNGIKR